MKNSTFKILLASLALAVFLIGCSTNTPEPVEDNENETTLSKGEEYTNVLTNTDWQGTIVYDKDKNDLTEENSNFVGLAKYDKETGYYEFFDKETKETRGDEGTFFITNDGSKRILISTSMNYQAVVEITELTDELFTYKRMGKDKDGNDVEIFVEHIPYSETELSFTSGRDALNTETGEIVKEDGSKVLSNTLWNGTVVLDEEGNDVTEYNQMFISLAKFDDATSKYEFFNLESGESRGDFGYYSVIYNNKIRTHVSIGENKYGAVLEITEINDGKFTYKRMGQNADGEEIVVYVEHEPYTKGLKPEFTF